MLRIEFLFIKKKNLVFRFFLNKNSNPLKFLYVYGKAGRNRYF